MLKEKALRPGQPLRLSNFDQDFEDERLSAMGARRRGDWARSSKALCAEVAVRDVDI